MSEAAMLRALIRSGEIDRGRGEGFPEFEVWAAAIQRVYELERAAEGSVPGLCPALAGRSGPTATSPR